MSYNHRYVAKNPENAREKLSQMADLVCCPEEMIVLQYNNFIKELPQEEAYKACCIILDCWQKHYIPLIEKLRQLGTLKKQIYSEL